MFHCTRTIVPVSFNRNGEPFNLFFIVYYNNYMIINYGLYNIHLHWTRQGLLKARLAHT